MKKKKRTLPRDDLIDIYINDDEVIFFSYKDRFNLQPIFTLKNELRGKAIIKINNFLRFKFK